MTQHGFVHRALIFGSDAELAEGLRAPVASALARGESVFAFVDGSRWDQLVRLLPDLMADVTHVAAEVRYGTPAIAVQRLREVVAHERRAGVPRVLSIGELPFDGSPVDLDWIRYEAAVNEIFREDPVTGLCLFDRARVPASLLETVPCTHPGPVAGERGDATLADIRHFASGLPRAPLAPDRRPDHRSTEVADARSARKDALEWAIGAGVDAQTASDLELLVDELVVNAHHHGGTPPDVAVWWEPPHAVLAVTDRGPGIDDPYAGLRPPDLVEQGAGLWMTAQLGERYVVRPGPDGCGTEVAVRLRSDRRS